MSRKYRSQFYAHTSEADIGIFLLVRHRKVSITKCSKTHSLHYLHPREIEKMNGYADPGGPSTSIQPVEVPLGATNQPRLFVRSLTKDEAVLQLSGVEMGLANSLRRVVMADVPTVGE